MRLRSLSAAAVQAATAARASPLRTSLAATATAAAVATIVIVIGALEAVAAYARVSSARAFGSDTFVVAQVASGNLSRRELAARLQRNPPVRASDARFLDRVAAERVMYAPTAQRPGDLVAGNRRFENAAINGTSAALPAIRLIELGAGRFFSEGEAVRAAAVTVIGDDIATTLFPTAAAIGQRVRIAGRAFTVVGVVARQGQSGGVSLDRYAYVPLGAFERAFGSTASLQLFARATPGWSMTAAESQAHASMRARRQLQPGDADTFDVITPEAARAFALRLAERIGAAAFPVSLMALLTAIVVVSNTVLVSVTERIREIGVRRAVGAPRSQVVSEVLFESLITACAGGAVGVTVALMVLAVVSSAIGFRIDTSGATLVGALTAAAGTGLAAGYLPARRAARIDVIAALRSE